MPQKKELSAMLSVMRKSLGPELILKYWWLICILLLTLFTFITWGLPSKYGQLTGLDEFYVYRMSDYVLNHNLQFPEIDYMRYWPDGVSPWKLEVVACMYVPVLFYLLLQFFGIQMSFLHFAIIYPAITGALSIFVIFWIGKELFNDKKAGLFAAMFLSGASGYISRTAAGGFEKEATGGLFILLFMYFFIRSYKQGSIKYSLTAGVFLSIASWAWGGALFIYYVLPAFFLLLLILNRCNEAMLKSFFSLVMGIVAMQFLPFYAGLLRFNSITTIAIFLLLSARYLAGRFKLIKEDKLQYFLPVMVIAGLVFVLVGSMFSDYLWGMVHMVISLVTMEKGVMGTTVAEQMPGNWDEIIHRLDISFALPTFPYLQSIEPIFSAWFLMLLGAAFMFYLTIKKRSPVHIFVTLILSFISLLSPILAAFLVFGWAIVLKFGFKNLDESNELMLLTLLWLFMGATTVFFMVRLIFFLTPPAVLAAGFCLSKGINLAMGSKWLKGRTTKGIGISVLHIPLIAFMTLLLLTNLTSAYIFCASIGPIFNQYWADSMNWVSAETPENSSILSWWDFGYWFQTEGHRPSIADGGNTNGTVNEQIAQWFTSDSKNWTDFRWWLKAKDVKYILMDYSLPGKYGAISKIASAGKNVIGMLEFRQTAIYPQQNKTIVEFRADPYTVWLPVTENGNLAGAAIFMVSSGSQYMGKTYISDYCTASNGIIRFQPPENSNTMPGCIAVTNYGLFFVPAEAEFTIFTNLMFMEGYGIPDVKKVYPVTQEQLQRNPNLIAIYKLEINETA